MALLTVGSVRDFSVVPRAAAKKALVDAARVDNFSVLAEVSNKVPPKSFDFLTSKNRRGLALHSLQLKKEFQNFIARLFNMKSDIYFLAWAWDMSGLSYYPGEKATPNACLIPLKGSQLREFIGSGVVLFPPRPITAGLALRIQIWESRQKTQKFGAMMEKIASTIKGSDLNTALLGLAGATGGAAGALAIVEPAALELAALIGDILKNSADEFVDYFEGYFPASEKWAAGNDKHEGNGTSIVLNRLV